MICWNLPRFGTCMWLVRGPLAMLRKPSVQQAGGKLAKENGPTDPTGTPKLPTLRDPNRGEEKSVYVVVALCLCVFVPFCLSVFASLCVVVSECFSGSLCRCFAVCPSFMQLDLSVSGSQGAGEGGKLLAKRKTDLKEPANHLTRGGSQRGGLICYEWHQGRESNQPSSMMWQQGFKTRVSEP